MLNILNVLFGGALLVAGRRIFWFFVAAIGFVIGVTVATRVLRGNDLFTILAGLALGVLFALLALFLESVAIGIAGFLGGGYAGLSVAELLGAHTSAVSAIAFVIGGIVGLILVFVLFEWALVTISSFVGAAMVLAGLHLQAPAAATAFLILMIAGVLIQGFALRRGSATPRRATS